MKLRLVLRPTLLILLSLFAESLGTNEFAEAAQADYVSSPAVPSNVVYRPVSGILFGTPCCIGPQSIQQGGLGDCYFMSSLAAVAMWSPGTIQRAIRYNPASGTYSVTLYRPSNSSPDAPLTRSTYTINGDLPTWSLWNSIWHWNNDSGPSSDVWGNAWSWLNGVAGALWHPTQLPAAVRDVPSYATPVADVLWPALMEKAYAAMLPGGYSSLGMGGGGYDAMRALTGAGGQIWVISHESTTNLLRSVTVKNVGSVANLRGHGVLAGIFGGKGLTGIEPDLQVCVSPVVAGSRIRKCTPICKAGYECTERFGQTGVDMGNENAALDIDILDVPAPGQENMIVHFVQPNPLRCTAKNPCPSPSQVSGTQDAPDQPIFVSFTTEQAGIGAKTISTLADMDRVLTSLAGRPVTVGTLAPCAATVRCVDETASAIFSPGGQGFCLNNQPCLDTGHEYYLENYQREGGSLARGIVTVGNPWGAGRDVKLTLENLMRGFLVISANDVSPDRATACPCSAR